MNDNLNIVSIDDILTLIKDERNNNLEVYDVLQRTKNDWLSVIGYILFETAGRTDKHVSFEEYRTSLIKAAAHILLALEVSFYHDDIQNIRGKFDIHGK